MIPQRPLINHKLRVKRLAAGMTESQLAEAVARLVSAETGRGAAIDGNYVSKLERGKITWPNSAYRRAFRVLFDATTDAELGFYAMRTRRDAERWLPAPDAQTPGSGAAPSPPVAQQHVSKLGKVLAQAIVAPLATGCASTGTNP